MSKYIKKAGKGTSNLASGAMKTAISGMIAEIFKDILKETGAGDLAKEKVMEAGMKVIKESGLDVKSLQRDLFKKAIMNELKIK